MNHKILIHPRSIAFHVSEPGQRAQLLYWTIDETWNKPGVFYIRECQVECLRPGSVTRPIIEDLNERDAYGKLAEVERTAAAKYPPADVDDKDLRARLGDSYFVTARHFPDCYMPTLRENALDTLRQRRKTANLGLKPR